MCVVLCLILVCWLCCPIPADPALVHSLYLAVVKPWSEAFPASDVVSLGRVGAKVKKNVLLCSTSPDGEVVYHTLQWAGIA